MILKTQSAILPIGSLEQHGEHLPVSTDSMIAEYIAERIAERIPVFILPVLCYGISHEHRPMFNISLRTSTLSKLICDICSSLSENGFRSIVILNGHHGNTGVLQYIAQNVYGRISSGTNIYPINYWKLISNEFDHAGDIETSLLLAIAPNLVNMNKAKPNSRELLKSKFAYSSITSNPGAFPKLTGNGVWGDPTKATVQKGEKLLREIVKNVLKVISELE